MILKLKTKKSITILPATKALKEDVSEVTVCVINDNTDKKMVNAFIKVNDVMRRLILWEGKDYDNIGDWTQKQANDRIEELL